MARPDDIDAVLDGVLAGMADDLEEAANLIGYRNDWATRSTRVNPHAALVKRLRTGAKLLRRLAAQP